MKRLWDFTLISYLIRFYLIEKNELYIILVA